MLLLIMNVIGEARTWTNEEGNLMAQLPYWVISGTIHVLTQRFMSKGLSVHPSQPQVRGAQPSHIGPLQQNRESGLANNMEFGMGLFLLRACSLCKVF